MLLNCTDTGWSASGKAGKTSLTTFGLQITILLFFNDGITFTFPKNAAIVKTTMLLPGLTTDKKKCYGMIDVNGEKNPNKMVNLILVKPVTIAKYLTQLIFIRLLCMTRQSCLLLEPVKLFFTALVNNIELKAAALETLSAETSRADCIKAGFSA